jgi:reverse gyrase
MERSSRPTKEASNSGITQAYTELVSPAEEKELESLLDTCVTGTTDIDELAESLTNSLNSLETENIYSIIEADLLVRDVVEKLENASEQLNAIEVWLNNYNSQLKVTILTFNYC